MIKKTPQQYVVRKYVSAYSAVEAIRKEKAVPVHDVFIDDDWKKTQQGTNAIGFDYKEKNHDET